MNNNAVSYSVVVPVYNSEGSLKLLYERLKAVFGSLDGAWELVAVNDCSKDNSWNVLQELAREDSRVTAVNLYNNFGQHNAIMCGFAHAGGTYVITMDDDLQHPPEEILKLAETIAEGGFSVVYGQYITKKHGWFRSLCSSWVNAVIAKITGSGYKVTSFRIIKHEVIQKLTDFKRYNVMIDVLIKDMVNRRDVGHVSVEHHVREIGKSNYSYGKLFAYALNMIFNYTIWPLRLGTILGLSLAVLSVLLGIYFFVDYFIHRVPVAGFTSTMVAMTFLFGTILFVVGVIGEYIGRMFLNINQRPQYFVKEVYKNNNS